MKEQLVERGLWSGNEFAKLKMVRSPEEAVDYIGETSPSQPDATTATGCALSATARSSSCIHGFEC